MNPFDPDCMWCRMITAPKDADLVRVARESPREPDYFRPRGHLRPRQCGRHKAMGFSAVKDSVAREREAWLAGGLGRGVLSREPVEECL